MFLFFLRKRALSITVDTVNPLLLQSFLTGYARWCGVVVRREARGDKERDTARALILWLAWAGLY